MKINNPNYFNIYFDLINEKFPSKIGLLDQYLEHKTITALDVLTLEKKLFKKVQEQVSNRAVFRAYKLEDIKVIIDFQTKNNWTNTKVAKHFGVSRNSIIKWKKIVFTNNYTTINKMDI